MRKIPVDVPDPNDNVDNVKLWVEFKLSILPPCAPAGTASLFDRPSGTKLTPPTWTPPPEPFPAPLTPGPL